MAKRLKAVIMAGGEGTRLRPLSLGSPKPMTPLLGRPVMEHIIQLLRGHGVEDICVTLCYKPQAVMDYFGGGERLGVRLTYLIEEEPLGTAGSVKSCMTHLGREDFLVISGDCVCDLDLTALLQFHRERGAEATLGLYRHPSPLEYGLVLTGEGGRVERFVEKPGWGQVFTDQINTGIYLLSPAAMDRVPEGTVWDFGKDLFPAMLREGAPLYGLPLEGYWRDMGDCKAYLDCACDALSGKVKLDMGLPKRDSGVWSARPLPNGINLIPPCWIGEGVTLGEGSRWSPYRAGKRGVGRGAGHGTAVHFAGKRSRRPQDHAVRRCFVQGSLRPERGRSQRGGGAGGERPGGGEGRSAGAGQALARSDRPRRLPAGPLHHQRKPEGCAPLWG